MAARVVSDGLRPFLATETGSTLVLLAATAAGLVWANSPWGDTYDTFWRTDLSLHLGTHAFALNLRDWVNTGLMAVFFFVIGLEVSREVQFGQLRDRRMIAVPVMAALGGMILPALIYFALNAGGAGAHAWGIPIASDTAFVLGLLAVIGTRCPEPLRAFLLTLSVVDDVGAMLVVAIFYTENLWVPALLVALVFVALIVALRKINIWRAPAYVLLGIGVWAATLKSGVHPTLAGILLGALVLVYAPSGPKLLRAGELVQALSRDPSPELAREATRSVQRTVSVNERLQFRLHPWTSYVIVPIFALANAGVRLDAETLRRAATSPITLGIALGLVAGKFAGVTLGAWIPLRLRWGDLPGDLVWGQILGGAAVAGIGFTVSLFIADLAFADDAALQSQAKIGILVGSSLAAGLGWLVFRLAWDRGAVCAPPAPSGPPDERDVEPEPLPPVTGGDHVLGPADAPVTLVEYGDFECPYCGKAEKTLARLRERYGDKLRFVFRHFPLREIHPRAVPAALISEAAGDHGLFWEMHGKLFDNQLALTDADLTRYADELGFDPWTDIDRHRARVNADLESGERSGVMGTPSFFINGEMYEGDHDLNSFVTAIDAALKSSGTKDFQPGL
ncbi:Na+/H+ antiporter NhaA [Actinomadura fulvescens]|uniref:Na(+)/H(+) antiporter NhaA n=2 Tax=Actinomadura fulvescens TaxID=46160 RepID=A0ABP6C8P5_9ACTN